MVGILLGPGQAPFGRCKRAMPSPEEQARIIAAGNKVIEDYHKEAELKRLRLKHEAMEKAYEQRIRAHEARLHAFMDQLVAEGVAAAIEDAVGTVLPTGTKVLICKHRTSRHECDEDMEYTDSLIVAITGPGGYEHVRWTDDTEEILMAYTSSVLAQSATCV